VQAVKLDLATAGACREFSICNLQMLRRGSACHCRHGNIMHSSEFTHSDASGGIRAEQPYLANYCKANCHYLADSTSSCPFRTAAAAASAHYLLLVNPKPQINFGFTSRLHGYVTLEWQQSNFCHGCCSLQRLLATSMHQFFCHLHFFQTEGFLLEELC